VLPGRPGRSIPTRWVRAQAARAVELLRQAVAKGYRDVADMKKQPHLDSLRARADFRQLLAELEAKSKESGVRT
jgi:hypothetical protein